MKFFQKSINLALSFVFCFTVEKHEDCGCLLDWTDSNYDYIAGQPTMRKNKREGFQFSFGLKEHQEPLSARSTPKFPSIEINKSTLSGSERKNYTPRLETEPIEIRKSPWDLFQEIGGGIELLQRGFRQQQRASDHRSSIFTPYNGASSLEAKDNKSVKSTKSLGERLLRRVGKNGGEKQTRLVKQQKGQKHSSSLANILEHRTDSSPNFKLLTKHRNAKISNFSLGKQHQEDGRLQERDTLKMENPFFENSRQIEFRETKKMLLPFEKGRLAEGRTGESERSKVFKNFLHKPRPTLRLGPRTNNNELIDSISKKFDDPFF